MQMSKCATKMIEQSRSITNLSLLEPLLMAMGRLALSHALSISSPTDIGLPGALIIALLMSIFASIVFVPDLRLFKMVLSRVT